MILMMVVDDGNGMMFHKRRQSQDRVLRERILSITEGKTLWMNAYSYQQFGENEGASIRVEEHFLDSAKAGEYCFVENVPVKAYENKIEKVILFKWNRKYPGDQFLDIDFTKKPWILVHSEEFKGFSHERITMEVYQNENE